MSKPIVIALGEILWDMLPTGKRAGGAPVNFAYHASQNLSLIHISEPTRH